MAQQSVYGCPVHPSNSIFYARIDSLPKLAQSDTYTANMTASVLTWDSAFGVSASTSLAPTINAQFYYTPAYNGTWRYPAYYDVDRQAGSLGGNFPADHHTIVVDTDTCTIWETYHTYVNTIDGSIQTGQVCNGKPCNAQSGWKYDANSTALPTQGTTDAAGLPLLPLVWRAHEILDGAVLHPTRFTLSRPYIQAGHPIWPASGNNGWGGVNNPPYGARFRLKASATISLTGLTAQQQVYANTIITALQRYGMVLADVGSNMNAVVDDEAGQEPDIMAALNKVGGQIRAAQLEAVDLSSLMPSTASYTVADSVPAVGNTVGAPYTYLNIQAGTSIQLNAWVNGPAAGTAVSWQVASGSVGTVTADGLYTPPTNVSGVVKGVLRVTSVADPTASTTVYVRILPAGPIRIAAGLQSGTLTDKLKQVWQPNFFFRGGDTVYGSSYPGFPASSDPTQTAEMAVYQSFAHTYGNDFVTKLVVPNGHYNLHLMFAQPYANSSGGCTFQPTWHNHVSLEVQNQIQIQDFDFGAQIGYSCATPVDVNLTATVTDNVLEVALRNVTPDGAAQSTTPQFSGIEIISTDLGGTAAAPGQLSVGATALAFGAEAVNTTSTPQVFTVTNTGGSLVSISGISFSGANAADFKVTSNACSMLPVAATCNVSVAFAPSTTGTRTATLAITSNAINSPQVALSGMGGTPNATLNAGRVSFANQTIGTTSAAIAVTLSNKGTAQMNIATMALSGVSASDFQVVSNGCGSSIAAGSSCSVSVAFSPKGYGLRSAVLVMTSNTGSQAVSFSGKGTALSFPALWRDTEASWYLLPGAYASVVQQGQSGDMAAMADYDGDGKMDLALWRPSNGTWYVNRSSTETSTTQQWGLPGDTPVAGDYDGDGKTDVAVWRPSNGTWYVVPSRTGAAYTHQWGLPGDIPVPGDYDGDGKTDFALWRPSDGTWYVIPTSTGAAYTHQWGLPGDIPVAGDYDGDGKTDLAVWRPSSGTWYVIPSSTGAAYTRAWGTNGDVPVPGDYDGDGKTDLAFWRRSEGNWYVTSSKSGVVILKQWGLSTDTPVSSSIK